jgi:hypothetical protein
MGCVEGYELESEEERETAHISPSDRWTEVNNLGEVIATAISHESIHKLLQKIGEETARLNIDNIIKHHTFDTYLSHYEDTVTCLNLVSQKYLNTGGIMLDICL